MIKQTMKMISVQLTYIIHYTETTSNKCEMHDQTNHENDKEERKKTCFIEFHLLR
jgi:hypothetical protein